MKCFKLRQCACVREDVKLSGIIRYSASAVLAAWMSLGVVAEDMTDPAASVTTNGVTTKYATLTEAWADATNAQHRSVNARVTLLADATVASTLRTSDNGVLTLDLNDHVLAYVGANEESIIHRWASTLHVVDTAQTRTPRYFACDETGLWALTNEVTDRVVCGGLLTGGRAGAITHEFSASGGPHSISNVNFVGNWSASNGGAVSTPTSGMVLKIAESTFLGNVADASGGAISSAGPCEMTDCCVKANVATGLGGGLYLKLKGSLVRTKVVDNSAGTGGGVYLTYNPGGCFPAGVRIRMADGTERKVEDIVKGDVVATFDHVGGTNSSAAVFSIYRGTEPLQTFALSFASGARLDVADCHDLLLETTRKYVTIYSDNALSYVGKRFYNYATGGWDELTGVTATTTAEAHYSLYTRGHGNCVANGILTVPDDKDCFVNVYELDENLKADVERLAADVVTYGLATTADYPNVPPDEFAAHNMRYAHIAIGKGLTTQEAILYWNDFDYGPIVEKKVMPMMLASGSAATPPIPYLSVGEGAVVTGNVSAAGTDNVYLMSSVAYDTPYKPVIDILPDTANLDIGVTLSSKVGMFGWTNDVNYAAAFTSDNANYSVRYTADKTLELFNGIQVGDDAWATVENGVCTIIGSSDMWDMAAAKATPLWGLAITNVIVANGVTKVGAHVFEKMATVKDVSLAGSVTNVGTLAFHKCYLLTNVVSAATAATSVGDGAFLRCNSLERLHFGGAATFGQEAYTLQAGIRMVGDQPEVYPIPQIECGGYAQRLKGSNDLQTWHDIEKESQKLYYNFFKLVMEPVKP